MTKQPDLAPGELRAYRVLDLAMRMLVITDQELADRMGMTRQAVQQRRRGLTRIRLGDVDPLAAALEVNPLVFSLEPLEALQYLAEHHADLLIRTLRCVAA